MNTRIIPKWLACLLTACIVSLFLFPLDIRGTGLNSKMVLALLGTAYLVITAGLQQNIRINKVFLTLTAGALLVSLSTILSMTYNSTSDSTYLLYVVMMWTWLAAAYACICCIKFVHGQATLKLVAMYLGCVCAAQCIIAEIIQHYPIVEAFVTTYIMTNPEIFIEKNRLFGLGAFLDPAGARFAAVLIVMTVVTIIRRDDFTHTQLIVMGLAFAIISVIGNVISRTTTVGLVISALILFFYWIKLFFYGNGENSFAKVLLKILLIGFPIVVVLYNVSPDFKKELEFGFEGFFNLIEEGEWRTDSNDMLFNMYNITPDNLKTWIIGDGYFEGASEDPFYMGTDHYEFYKGTDVGYFRFIFYIGLIGLISFILFFVFATSAGIKKFHNSRLLFISLLLLNFILWFKVGIFGKYPNYC